MREKDKRTEKEGKRNREGGKESMCVFERKKIRIRLTRKSEL